MKPLRKHLRQLLVPRGFHETEGKLWRHINGIQQTALPYRSRFDNWCNLTLVLRVLRDGDRPGEYSQLEDLLLDIRDRNTDISVWTQAFDYRREIDSSIRQEAVEKIVNLDLWPLCEFFVDAEALWRVAKYESERIKFGAVVSKTGYELIGGYENHVDDGGLS